MAREKSARHQKGSRPKAKAASIVRSLSKRKPSGQGRAGKRAAGTFPVVGIGASAGGLDAFNHLLRTLPADTGMAFVMIQHLDPTHESMLTEILSRATSMPVREVVTGMRVEPDHVYVIPPNRTMELSDGTLRLALRAETNGRHMPIDHFFRSLAQALKNRAIGVVLSGTATDGALGIEAIKSEGGITFAQEENSARHHGMPRAAIKTGAVDFVLNPEGIAGELARIAKHPHLRLAESPERARAPADKDGGQILALLRSATGVDFSHYKQSTVQRRTMRRMALARIDRADEYLRFLRENPRELQGLYEDLLIRVTRFFRDKDTFQFLEKKIFPRIVKNRPEDTPVRVWVPGCATGEEVYSIIIGFLEACRAARKECRLQVYGTDVSEVALERARAGVYYDNSTADVSPERLRRFFVKTDGGYQVAKSVREVAIFARHNVLEDPPFLHLDLLSCRNVLIYIETALQKRLLPTFHHALNPTGFLLLGTAETIGTFNELFQPEDRHHCVFSKKPFARLGLFDYPRAGGPRAALHTAAGKEAGAATAATDPLKEADRIVLSQYAPAGVVINDALDVVQFRGQTGPYLEASPGAASFNILKMAREGLLVDLRASIQKARKTQARVRREGIRVKRDGGFREIRLEVLPFVAAGGAAHYLVLFEPAAPPAAAPKPEASGARALSAKRGEAARSEKLQKELAATKEYLQAIIEEQESTNEELRSANEEILSSNEELQSTNEELETAKEELQSANEELRSVNDELQNGNERLTLLGNDLANLLSSVSIPIVMLEKDGRIRRFTPMAEKAFHIVPGDVGRSIAEIRPRIRVPFLTDAIRKAVDQGMSTEREIQDDDGRWYEIRVCPYKTSENKIEGAVLLFLDENALKLSQQQLQKSLAFADAVIDTVREPLLVLDAGLRVLRANQAFYDKFDLSREAIAFQPIHEIGDRQWDVPELRALLEKVIAEDESFRDFRLAQSFGRVGEKSMLLNGRRTAPRGEEQPLILLAMEDDTERQQAEDRFREAQKLDSVGRLAAGIAHDFNNLLNIISAYASVLVERGIDPGRHAEGFEAIQRAVRRGSALVRQLLTFARKTEVVFDAVTLNTVVEEIVEILRATFPKEIVVEADLAADLPEIKADANQLHQAVLNLCVNARDAIPDGGTITVQTEQVDGEELRGRFADAAGKTYASVKVSDNGIGMDRGTSSRMFDPFFTTKNPGAGQGLGLAVVHGIVQSHHGFIDVSSEPGQGTAVQLFFPVSPGAQDAAGSRAESPVSRSAHGEKPRSTGGNETILLVEDEDMLREPVKSLLEGKGYRVLCARDGLEAVELYEREGKGIDLVILDVGLPRQGGRETLFRLYSLDPAVRILLASGYFDTDLKEEMLLAGAKAFLHKPYSAEEILRVTRTVLDRDEPGPPSGGERRRRSRRRPSLQ